MAMYDKTYRCSDDGRDKEECKTRAPATSHIKILAKSLVSANDWMIGTQPMDQSKHSHQGLSNSQEFKAYT